MQYLEKIHEKFVVVSVDKTSKNIAVICKLGLTSNIGNDTYTKVTGTSESVINRHKEELKENVDISLHEKMDMLPFIYWIPKFHKSPIKLSFIFASSKCTTNDLPQR